MPKSYDPRMFHVDHDCDGWFIGDDYDEYRPIERYSTREQAQSALDAEVADFMANYEPHDGPGWEAGFAENH